MDFYVVLDQVLALLRQRGRVSYRALKRQFDLDDAYLDDLKLEILEVQQCARDQEGTMLVWTGEVASAATPEPVQAPVPLAYTPPYLAEKILTSRSVLEGERKQVTVLFADLKGSAQRRVHLIDLGVQTGTAGGTPALLRQDDREIRQKCPGLRQLHAIVSSRVGTPEQPGIEAAGFCQIIGEFSRSCRPVQRVAAIGRALNRRLKHTDSTCKLAAFEEHLSQQRMR